MLRYAKWIAYRDNVLDQLGGLLVMYPRGRQFASDFPGLLPAIRAHFDSGVSPTGSAVQAAAQIAGDLIRQLGHEQRAAVLERLGRLDGRELEAIAARQISRRPAEPGDAVTFAANLAGVALLLARRMWEDGLVHRVEYEFLLGELDRAIQPGADKKAHPEASASLVELFPLPER